MLDLNDIHLQHHPVSQAFPLLVGHAFEHLVDDIRAHGLREPIWLDREGRILDGRNRDRACLLSGMPPAYRVYDGVDEVAFVISMNLHRRHLNESQRAMVAARIANLDHGGCRGDRDQDANLPLGSVSSEAAAELLNVSRRSVISARRIRDQGAPALVAAVDEGLVAVSDAAAVTGLAAADQQALVDAVRAGAHRTLRRAAVARRREAREMPTGELSAAADRFRLFVADVGSVIEQIEPGSIDCIVCDPPYPREFLPVYGDLARTAAQVLKPGGSCLVMAGQSYLPEILAAMTPHLRYHWTVAYLTPGGQSAQLWERRVNTFWKPVLWLIKDSEGAGHAGDWVSDVARSAPNDNDKRFHHWGQSESGMAELVRRFTRAGDTVFDPFLGGGTTGVAALASNRLFVGSDVNAEAVARSRRRLLDAIREIADAG